MNRGFLSLLAMVFLLGSVMNLRGQDRSGTPLFKITVQDGKITGASSLDTTGNSSPEKGRSLPWQIEPAHKVLDINNPNIHVKSGTDGDPMDDLIPLNYAPEAGWEVITHQTFEGSFPASGWECFANSGYTDAYWDENSYRSYEGSWSMFCADRGTAAVTPPMAYPMDMDAWAVYGPFDLSDATYAELDLMLWLDSESGYDFFQYMASTDGIDFYGYQISGRSDGWSSQNMDLTNVPTNTGS